jgi:hypothetical protein
MTTGMKKEVSLESKFVAHLMHRLGYNVSHIARVLKKDRSTIYYRIDLIDGWLRTYPDIRGKYNRFVANWMIGMERAA